MQHALVKPHNLHASASWEWVITLLTPFQMAVLVGARAGMTPLRISKELNSTQAAVRTIMSNMRRDGIDVPRFKSGPVRKRPLRDKRAYIKKTDAYWNNRAGNRAGGQVKLTQEQVEAIRIENRTWSFPSLAAKYNVSKATIRRAVRGMGFYAVV
jgi:predicted DNA-binding protein (UPF0251 family)